MSWVDEFDNDDAFRFGVFAGVSVEYDVLGDEDGDIRAGVFYIQKGSAGCCGPRHFVEASVLYKFGIDDISYVLVGATVGQRLDSNWDEVRYFSTPIAASAVGHQLFRPNTPFRGRCRNAENSGFRRSPTTAPPRSA